MTINYYFENQDFEYEINEDELVSFIENCSPAVIASMFSRALLELSYDKQAKMRRALGVDGRRDLTRLATENRAKITKYFMANLKMFETQIAANFKWQARSEFECTMIRNLVY